MKALVCEMCGSQDLQKADGMYVCQSCGTKYTTEEAKKLMVEVNVKIDNLEKLANLYQLARRARQNRDAASAAKYYAQILPDDPDSWEANFFATYYESMDCVIANIAPATRAVTNCLDNVIALIKNNLTGDERRDAVKTLAECCAYFARDMHGAALKHHMGIDVSIMSRFTNELRDRLTAAIDLMVLSAMKISRAFRDEPDVETFMQIPAETALDHLRIQSYVTIRINDSIMNEMLARIEVFDPEYIAKRKEKQSKSNRNSGIMLIIMGLIAAYFAFFSGTESVFLKYFCMVLVVFLPIGLFQIIAWAMGKKKNKK